MFFINGTCELNIEFLTQMIWIKISTNNFN